MRMMTVMALDVRNPPVWLAKLALSFERQAPRALRSSPSEGMLKVCLLSDDLQAFSRACFDAQHPHLNAEEKIHAFGKRRDVARYARDRFFLKSPSFSS